MQSKKSFFNKGVFISLLRRNWPVWLLWLIYRCLSVTGTLFNSYINGAIWTTYSGIFTLIETDTFFSFAFGMLAAGVTFNWMFNRRGVNMMSTLPVGREALYVTAVLSALVPVYVCDTLAFILAFAAEAVNGHLAFGPLLTWYACGLCGDTFYLLFGSFCSMLTGSIAAMPVIYIALSNGITLAEELCKNVFDKLIYGYNHAIDKLTYLSPSPLFGFRQPQADVFYSYDRVKGYITGVESWQLEKWWVFPMYAAVGVVFAVIALAIFKKRKMECAGDIAAFPVLRPVFKYITAIGGGLAFGVFVSEIFRTNLSGKKLMIYLALLMLFGCVICYFAVEMFIKKSLRVAGKSWKGCVISCALLLLFCVATDFNLSGYETYIPHADEIDGVFINRVSTFDNPMFESEENIARITQLHNRLIDNKSLHDVNTNGEWMLCNIEYALKNGKTIKRTYNIQMNDELLKDETSDILSLESILNTPEGVISRNKKLFEDFDIDAVKIDGNWNCYWEDGTPENGNFRLSSEQVEEFLTTCIIPDISEGKLGKLVIRYDQNSEDIYTAYIYVNNESLYNGRSLDDNYFYYGFDLCVDAERTVNWLLENTNIKLQTQKEFNENVNMVNDYPVARDAEY